MVRDTPNVLVVGCESDATKSLIAFLRAHGIEVVWARDDEAAFNALDGVSVNGLVCEVRGQRIDGLAVMRRTLDRNPEACVVMVAESDQVDLALEAMRRGAYDFQVHPLNLEKLLAMLRRGATHQRLAARLRETEERLEERFGRDRFTGRSRAILRVVEQVRHIAPTRATVLIEGETGTGKGWVAQAIHQGSPRRNEAFASLNCAELAEAVIEAELFGHGGGPAAASPARRGRCEIADGGTLFLDEVSELPPSVQVKLLRLIQDRAFERVGGSETLHADVRLVVASTRDLAVEVRAGRFREDLHLRLGVARIRMPALRERREDIPLLVARFIREFSRMHGRRITGITRGALERLSLHDWPGNVRELRNTIEGMLVLAEGRRALDLSDLPDHLREAGPASEHLHLAVGMTLAEAERHLIAATLARTDRDKVRTAQMLGIGLRTLYRKIKLYRLQ